MMPSYVNIGAYVGEGSMVDTWATVGSCAQVGKNVHLSGGVGVGGVLEPPQAAPVIIEDDAFIGSRSIVVEGARVCRGAKLGAGVVLTAVAPRSSTAPPARSCRGASFPSGRSRCPPPGSSRSRAATSACPACWCCGSSKRARCTTSSPSTTSCATTASPHDRRRAGRGRRRSRRPPADDLLGLTAALIAVPSVSLDEEPLADAVEAPAAPHPGLDVERVGLNVVARTDLGRERRVVMAGHLDTVPANNNTVPRIEGDVLHGLGAADMKSGVAVLLRLAEEVAADEPLRLHLRLLRERRRSPTSTTGCASSSPSGPTSSPATSPCSSSRPTCGSKRAARARSACEATFHGRPGAHRPALAGRSTPSTGRRPSCSGWPSTSRNRWRSTGSRSARRCQVVHVHGGVAGNVVPDRCTVVVNRRYAPSLTLEEAEAEVRALLDGADEIALDLGLTRRRHPNLSHPLVAEFAGAARPARPLQARLDRRRPLHRPRRARGELRPRRPRGLPHRRRT